MRALLTLLLATTALPALADTLLATSKITAVTVYPEGARLTREVTFAAPAAGAHDLVVTDLPAYSEPGLIQIAGGAGVQLGAFNIRADRLPPREDPLTPDQQAARAEVERLEAAQDQALLALDAVQARVDAAEAQVRFLSSFTGGLPDGATPDSIKAMATMIGTETLAARQAALAARADLYPAQKALEDAAEALAKAQAAYDALPSADMDYTALSVALTAEAAGDQTLTITQYISGAGWRPFYQLDLTRQGEGALALNRSVLVTQYTGEDWSDVALTLSSSAPTNQAQASGLWPELRYIEPEMDEARKSADDYEVMPGAVMEEPVMAAAPIAAGAALEGDTVVYLYPEPVTIATGAEDLRLSLDTLSFAPVVKAVAVPRYDSTAFVTASFTNASDEPLLPGEAMLFREGVLVGSTYLDVIAPGVETELGFGAIETLRVKREMPVRAEGESGVFTTSNELSESAVLTVENTGPEAWTVRLLDQVPYSEQDELEITVSASPEPSETDVDGQRGILAWEFDLPPGAKETITLEHSLNWPDGMELR